MQEYYLCLIRGEQRGLWPWLLRLGLWLLSIPYAIAARARNWLFDAGWKKTHEAPIPVISIGNLTVGGTGKTPCVEYVAKWFRRHDLRVVILSRGYGVKEGPNDEALLLEENLPDVPHLQGPDRSELATTAAEELESEVAVLDDGFQHRRLARNLDIVLIDALAPWGYGSVLPRGLLREPLSGLQRASLILVTRSDQVTPEEYNRILTRIQSLAPDKPIVQTTHSPTTLINSDQETSPLSRLQETKVAAFCGIGNPQAFRNTLEMLDVELVDFRTFSDHHAYTREDVEDLRRWARNLAMDCVIVTTQKDLVKIRLNRIGERQLWALRIELRITEGRDRLDRMLKEAAE
ncbi:MAG: tetraacyldisaccharide 4'-kinase [Gemmataceae bacterium]